MNSYELLYIIDNDLSDEAKENLVAKISAVVTDNGGTVDGVDKWGTRKLAYPINYKSEGYYVLVNFTAPATLPSEVERVLRITDGVVRFWLLKIGEYHEQSISYRQTHPRPDGIHRCFRTFLLQVFHCGKPLFFP